MLLEKQAPPFAPLKQSELKRWYRLAASTVNAGEYDSVVEMYGGSPIVQTDADRKPAAATSANGFPVATFDGTDIWLQPLETGNVGTSKWWMFFRIKPADLAAGQAIHYITNAAGLNGAANANRSRLALFTTGKLSFDIFVSGTNGRNYLTAGTLTAATWSDIYVQFDSTKTAECDTDGATADAKLRIAIGGAFTALTASNVGTGGTVSALNAATGSAIIGGSNDADAPVVPIRNGGLLADLFFGDEPLSAFKLNQFRNFEVRT